MTDKLCRPIQRHRVCPSSSNYFGSVIELDKDAADPVDLTVNGKLIARGEIVVVDDSFGIRVNEILDPGEIET